MIRLWAGKCCPSKFVLGWAQCKVVLVCLLDHAPTVPIHLMQEESVHDSLAISICNELLSDPLSSEVRVYCRTLSSLDLTPSNAVSTMTQGCAVPGASVLEGGGGGGGLSVVKCKKAVCNRLLSTVY